MTDFSTEDINSSQEQVQNIEKEEQVQENMEQVEKAAAYTPNAVEDASNESESFAMNHGDFSTIQAQLESEGLGVLDGTNLIPEDEETPLYMGTPVSAGDSEGIDVPEQVEHAEQEEQDEEGPETAPETPQSCPVLTAGDTDLLYRIRELGGAATLWEVARYRAADMDRITGGGFAGNGDAFYREHRGHTVIALAGATESDLTKATNRAEAEKIGMRFESSMDHAHFTAWGMIQRLINLGGSGSLDGAKRHLNIHGFRPRSIRPVLAELHERGVIRVSVKGAAPQVKEAGERDTRTRFLTLANAREGALANAAHRHAKDEREIPARRAEAADQARRRGQGKAFVAPMVPFGGTTVTPEQQARALYIEHAKARYDEAELKGVQSVELKLAASGTTETLPAEEVTLYTAPANGAREFFTARIKGRILTGLRRYEVLAGSRILPVLFPKEGAEAVTLLAEGRGVDGLSPALAEPYTLFTEAVNELISEGRIQRTRKGLALAPEKAAEKASAAKAAKVSTTEDWADRAPEPERQSGPDAHGRDKYAADMAEAHDHRQIATGPQAPSTRPAQRRRTAKRIAGAVRKAEGDPARVKADSEKAECRQAWNQARGLYMAALSPQDRLELHLQLECGAEGEQRLERMLEEADEPDELYHAMITLKDEDRIKVSARGGYTIISRARELDREHLASELVEVMVTEEIPVPTGTILAARVHNAREELERSQAFAAVS